VQVHSRVIFQGRIGCEEINLLFKGYLEDITKAEPTALCKNNCEKAVHVNKGCYTAVRRYEFNVLVARTSECS